MLLSELHGYKQYLGKSARKVLMDLSQKHGAYAEHGAFAVVIMTRHNFVYKLWRRDPAWEGWLEYIKENPSRHFVKVLSPVKDFPFDITNPTSDNPRHQEQLRGKEGKTYKLKYCKLEKLKSLPEGEYEMIEMANMIDVHKYSFERFIARLEAEVKNVADEFDLPADMVEQHHDFLKVYYEVGKHFAQEHGEHDMHPDNVMQRPDGTLVITDPASPDSPVDSIEAPELVQLFDTELKRA